ncbi:MAG: beta strand repeat-containing protein [Rhodanobacteraceae bacterium]
MNKSFRLTTLTGAIALAMGSSVALAAAPTATQLPGQGAVTLGSATAGAISNGSQTITQSGATVINWGVSSGATINTGTSAQPAGFNIGSAANLQFNGSGGVLNVDVSGNASQIMGTLANTGGNLFVANANGVIVGATAVVSASGSVGFIANTLGDTSTFAGGIPSLNYNGTGGDVTVNTGATINSGNKILISGGDTVNVDLSTLQSGAVTLSAGEPFNGGAFAAPNPDAMLAVSSALGGGATLTSFASAGDASSSGTLDLGANAMVEGTLTNTGTMDLGTGFDIDGAVVNNNTMTASDNVSAGSIANNGAFEANNYELTTTNGGLSNSGQMTDVGGINVQGGDFANDGQFASNGNDLDVTYGNLVNGGAITGGSSVYVYGGNFTNNGSFAAGGEVSVTNGSIVNNGKLSWTGYGYIETYSDASDPSFTAGADYSITNAGTIYSDGTGDDGNWFIANDQGNQADATGSYGNLNGSTGSFTNTGTLQFPVGGGLYISANNDITLGGVLQTNDGAGTVKAISASNPLGFLDLEAGNYDYNDVFTSAGVLTVTTDVATEDNTFLAGSQVNLLSNISGVDGSGNPDYEIDIVAGAQQTVGYAIRVAAGKTISADEIYVDGDQAGDNPNVILQGTLAANDIEFGDNYGVSDVFSGPAGGLQMWADGATNPYLYINATGRVKTAPYNNDANFRFNYLPVNVTDGSTLNMEIDPSNMQGTPTSGVNLLVNSNVTLDSDMSATVAANGSAVTGVDVVPNSHFVLQSTGSIETGYYYGDFYWPGYIYLGNISTDADGNALPGTLGLGTITTDGDFNNVLPGDIAGASGIHFITQFPMTLGGNVITNANAWVNFGTALLTQAYSSGTLGAGLFFGGTQGPGSVINYGPLDPSDFVTQPPVSDK